MPSKDIRNSFFQFKFMISTYFHSKVFKPKENTDHKKPLERDTEQKEDEKSKQIEIGV